MRSRRSAAALLLVLAGCAAGSNAPSAGPDTASPRPAPTAGTAPLASSLTVARPAPSSGAAGATAAERPAGTPVLRAYFEAQRSDGSRHPLVDGDTLHNKDHFWFELSAQEPMYVYVVYAAADGSASVLYPDSGDVVLKPGSTERLPKSLDFVLDDVTGWERVLVIASRAPLSQADSSFARLVDRVRSSRTWPDDAAAPGGEPRPKPVDSGPKKPQTPPAAQPKPPGPAKVYEGPTPVLETRLASADRRGLTRGIHLGSQQPGHVAAVPDEQGIVTIPLFIRHVP